MSRVVVRLGSQNGAGHETSRSMENFTSGESLVSNTNFTLKYLATSATVSAAFLER